MGRLGTVLRTAGILAVGGGLLGTAAPARADEPLFGFVYTTDILPQGKAEVEQWLTWRRQKGAGSFNVLEGRTEFEYGVTNDFQASIYANYNYAQARQNGLDGTTTPPESFAGYRVDPNGRLSASKFVGVSLEGIWRLLSPYKDPIGLALYFEPTIGNGLREFESKIIVQKNFLDDRLVLASNLTIEQEFRRLPAEADADPDSNEARARWDKETDVNLGIGLTYRFASNWSFGWEFEHEREFSRLIFWNGKYATNVAYYTGPTLHYGGESFFATLSFLQQLPWGQDYADQNVMKGGINYADDFEKYRVRLKVGANF